MADRRNYSNSPSNRPQRFELQKEAIEDLGFSHAEANQFRELFMTADKAWAED